MECALSATPVTVVPMRGHADEFRTKVCVDLVKQECFSTGCVLQPNPEDVLKVVADKVAKSVEACQLGQGKKDSTQSMGAVSRYQQTLQVQVRTWRLTLEKQAAWRTRGPTR